MEATPRYDATRNRVEAYFDRTATRAWAALTSDAPVSRIRQTVRAGREDMRALMLSRLPEDLSGARVLDAGCGTGASSAALAERGADVVGVDIAPELIRIADARLPDAVKSRVQFVAGDMLDARLGAFDAVIAMDSLIYYDRPDLIAAVAAFDAPQVVFTVAPRTVPLMLMWGAGKLFPRRDRSPTMVPHPPKALVRHVDNTAGAGTLMPVSRVARGFYISECLEYRR